MVDRTSYLLIDLIGGSDTTADKIVRLAERVRRLAPSHRDPGGSMPTRARSQPSWLAA